TDDQLGRIVDELRALKLYDKTIIVVTGDHGEGFGEHGIKFHGYHLYAAQTKVPLIIRVPNLSPRRVAAPAGHVDLLPTVVNLAQGPPTATMAGRSLVSEISGNEHDAPPRAVFQEVSYENEHERRAVATDKWHLIYNMSPDSSWELYDLSIDPNE